MSEAALAPGLRLGERYTLVQRLGVGGFGAVWRADDAATGEPVAIKVLHPALAEAGGLSLARFRREAEVLARLDHPSIARWRDHAIDATRAFLVVELVDGLPLDRVLHGASRRGAPLELGEVRAIVSALAGAVAYAHGAGVVHRDLKPANVMITRGPGGLGVKVLDFGIARVAGEAQDRTTVGRVLGSYLYMAPEQLRGERPDARADVFALGAILFELLTAHRAWARDANDRPLPFHASIGRRAPNDLPSIVRRIQHGPRPRPSDVVDGLPLELDDLVERALATTREARPSTASALAEAVERVLAAESPHTGRTGLTVVALEAEVRAALLAALPLSDAAPARVEAAPGVAAEPGPAPLGEPATLDPLTPRTPLGEASAPLRRPLRPQAATRPTLGAGLVAVLALGLALAAAAMLAVITYARPAAGPPRADAVARDAGAERPTPTVEARPVAAAEPVATATVTVTPTPTVAPTPTPTPTPRPRGTTARAATPSGAPRGASASTASSLAGLERTLAHLRAAGADPAERTALADGIRAEALRAPPSAARTRVLRQAEQGLATGDLDRRAEALAALRRLEAP